MSLGSEKGAAYNRLVHTTVEAEVDEQGVIRTLEAVSLPPGARLLITVLEPEAFETALASESMLAGDWNRTEEDAAWADLRPEP
jgi:hypothetical protein